MSFVTPIQLAYEPSLETSDPPWSREEFEARLRAM